MNKLTSIANALWGASIRRQLMLGIVLVHAVLMSLFVYDLVDRQREFLHAQSISQAYSLTETLATNSQSWVLANDIVGLEEIVQSQIRYPGLEYAMVLSPEGRVLAHTSMEHAGSYLSDEVSRVLVSSDLKQETLLIDTDYLIDVASPIVSHGELIGWARVGLSQEKIETGLYYIMRDGIVYTMIAIVIGAVFAFFMAAGITRGLAHVVTVAEGVRRGNYSLRSGLSRQDEIGLLGQDFNLMLDTIEQGKNELNNALNSLQEREQNLLITLNSIGDAVIATDAQGRVTRMNPVAESLTGWLSVEAEGHPLSTVFSIVDAKSRELIKSPIDKVLVSGEVTHLSNNTTLLSKNGREYQIADSAAPIRNGDEKILGMVLVFNDVTEQYKLRQGLAQSEEQVRLLLNSTAEAIYGINTLGECTFVNQSCLDMLGYETSTDLVGEKMSRFFHGRKRDNAAASETFDQTKKIYVDNQIIEKKNGDLFPVEYWSYPVFKNDHCVGSVVTFLDITDRKRMERALKENEYNLIRGQQMAKLGSWKLSLRTKKVDCSDELLKIFGTSRHELNFKSLVGVIHPDDHDDVLAMAARGVDNGQPWDTEHRLLLNNGVIKWIHTVGEPVFDDGGKVISLVGVVQDISDRKLADEVVRRTQKMDALGKLSGGIAHDYNNMLGVIMGYAELLESSLADQPRLAKFAHEIFHAGERGSKLTKKLLSFSQQKSGNNEQVDINELLNAERNMLEKTLTARISLQFNLQESLWPVWLEAGDFEDAILNMSINAMHAIEGHGVLALSTENKTLTDKNAQSLGLNVGDYVLVQVSDTGCGMTATTKDKLFEPFYSTKGTQGTGLGLSQVYGFVERSKGMVVVESTLSEGSNFRLYFPRYDVDSDGGLKDEVSEEQVQYGFETILVVDDEPALLALCSEILGQQGYKVICAESGAEALSILDRMKVDLLLSDVIMPDMDGYQLAAIVKERYPSIQIQLASGYTDNQHRPSFDRELHEALIPKPYSAQTLLLRVSALLA